MKDCTLRLLCLFLDTWVCGGDRDCLFGEDFDLNFDLVPFIVCCFHLCVVIDLNPRGEYLSFLLSLLLFLQTLLSLCFYVLIERWTGL